MFKKLIPFIKSNNIRNECSYNNNIRKYIKNIGDTPIIKLEENLYMKLEGHNPSGSIKDRPISNMIYNLMINNQLKSNKTMCIVSSGSAGMSLYNINKIINNNMNIVIAMPYKYHTNDIPKKLIDKKDVKVCYSYKNVIRSIKKNPGKVYILLLDDIFINIVDKMKIVSEKNQWIKLDQHYNKDCMNTHSKTCKEIIDEFPDVTDVVCSTGTGGTAAGLIKFLPKHVKVHSRATTSGEIDGLGDVEKYDNFCDQSKIHGYHKTNFTIKDAKYNQDLINRKYDLKVGQSTGASHWLANCIINPNKKVLIISPDGISM